MKILDFITRLILIPGIFLFVLCFIPEAIKDVKEWSKIFRQEDRETKVKVKKTVKNTGLAVSSNSLSIHKSLNI